MPRIRLESVPKAVGTLYPPPYDEPCRARERQRVGDGAGLTQFGVNVLTLPPGAWSAQRHFHSHEDELVYVLEGEVTLVTDQGSELLEAGDAAGFKAGEPNGHCLKNLSNAPCRILEIGSRVREDSATYPDIDLLAPSEGKPAIFTRKDGSPYLDIKRRGPGG
jgi:uncharacterized cupin superfamily protein